MILNIPSKKKILIKRKITLMHLAEKASDLAKKLMYIGFGNFTKQHLYQHIKLIR